MERIVFSDGNWISVPLPVGHDPSWTDADKWIYAAAYVSQKVESLAEAIVFKRLYSVTYDKKMEKLII